jgi:hypothetical protein
VAASLSQTLADTEEGKRLARPGAWRRWGPYLSERQWGTVREDYSPDGDAWNYISHDHARSRAYRWGEEGIAGFADDQQHWCLSLALWNGRDPILKERLFGLTNEEGNHGEDVKEIYYFLDGLPSHAYMRMLYRYPHAAFPYADLVDENRRRGLADNEYELIDTGVLNERRYFDVTVEYAKATPWDVLMKITVENCGPEAQVLHVLPHLWARNTWSCGLSASRPSLSQIDAHTVQANHPDHPPRRWHVEAPDSILFCENDTNTKRLFAVPGRGPFKDGINDAIVRGDTAALAASGRGTKCAALWRLHLEPGETRTLRLRFRRASVATDPFADFDQVFTARRSETDAFYAALQSNIADQDARLVQRQALAGLLWSKQFYYFNVKEWLDGDPGEPTPPSFRATIRNADWRHLNNADILTMPDTWEYPWYAAWDTGFHALAMALIDPAYAKNQMLLLCRAWYMHPNGQIPAYEWEFSDVNPPVQAWAAWRIYQMDIEAGRPPDRDFLERMFHKLMINFTWWVNRKDANGRNIFQGGFLGLDNIGVFNRSKPLPTGGTINQADGTAWMAAYALNMLRMALELAMVNRTYEDIGTKFFEHFLLIAQAMTRIDGEHGLWDEQDQFYYDVLTLPDGSVQPLRVRSMVGLIPLYAVAVLDASVFDTLPDFTGRMRWLLAHRPDLANLVSRWAEPAAHEQGQNLGGRERHLLSLLRGHRMKQLLRRMLDETEFLSDHGVRALSREHLEKPYVFGHDGVDYSVNYEPAESRSHLFGGNSNWRGPVWMPVNFLLIDSLREFDRYYGPDFLVECPTGSGAMKSLSDIADELSARLCRLFLRGSDGIRPALGDNALARNDPGFRDNLLFHEYFHGDTGQGLGASHQSGWTALVALLIAKQPSSGLARP